ncbi:ALF repeat-containing protein [Streptomyces sp. NPDC050560]|uniref:ALF repeat-containing protein n=1 Tax=Streptomyces sp. NPDC050560 TaxID=3365630 RepID=UPI00379812FB
MRPTRAALFVAATALTPALLLSAPAFAAGPSAPPRAAASAAASSDKPVDEMTEAELRAAIADILAENDGVAVVREANRALDGTVEDMRTFLKTGFTAAQFEDDRVALFRLLHLATQAGDRAVIAGVNEALDANTPEAARAFLETGYAKAQFEDDRVAISRLLYLATQAGDRAVIAGVNEALDANTPEAARAFRQTGYRLAQAEDDAVYIARMLADPDITPALRAAANAALDDGSPEALRYFRVTGQYEVEN